MIDINNKDDIIKLLASEIIVLDQEIEGLKCKIDALKVRRLNKVDLLRQLR